MKMTLSEKTEIRKKKHLIGLIIATKYQMSQLAKFLGDTIETENSVTLTGQLIACMTSTESVLKDVTNGIT